MAKNTTKTSATDHDDDQLASQLDAMLKEVEVTTSAAPPARGDPAVASADEMAAKASTSEQDAAMPPTDPNADDDLVNQLQELLDDAKAAEDAQTTSPTPPALASSSPASIPIVASVTASPVVPQATDVNIATPHKNHPTPVPASVIANPPQPPVTVDQIDDQLAENADDAVSGEFETVAEVQAAQATESESAPRAVHPAPTPAPVVAAAAPVVARAAIVEAKTDKAAADEAADDEDAIEGDFATASDPEGSTTADATAAENVGAMNAAVAGSAAAVAKELDELDGSAQPVDAVATAAAAHAPVPAMPMAPPEPAPPASLVVRTNPGVIKRFCLAINAPVARMSPEAQQGVGLVAAITFCLGMVLLASTMVSNAITKPEGIESTATATTSPGASASRSTHANAAPAAGGAQNAPRDTQH